MLPSNNRFERLRVTSSLEGIDELDKVLWFHVGEAPRRSTSSLGFRR